MSDDSPGPAADRLEKGRGLFNAGQFFEAHEAWEETWRSETGEGRRLLQGLIQIAAGCHKARGGHPAGCVRLLEAGLEKLAAAPAGSSVADFAQGVTETLAHARAWKRGEVDGIGAIPLLGPL